MRLQELKAVGLQFVAAQRAPVLPPAEKGSVRGKGKVAFKVIIPDGRGASWPALAVAKKTGGVVAGVPVAAEARGEEGGLLEVEEPPDDEE